MNIYLRIITDTHIYIIYLIIISIVIEYIGGFHLFFRSLFTKKTKKIQKGEAQVWGIFYFIFSFFTAIYKLYFSSNYDEASNRFFILISLLFTYVVFSFLFIKLHQYIQRKYDKKRDSIIN